MDYFGLTPETFWIYALASAAIVIVPGPSVLVIVANSLKRGARAGLLSVAGTQTGLLLIVLVLAFGFSAIIESLGVVFEIIRLAGALYLIWMGWKLWRADGHTLAKDDSARHAATGTLVCYWQSLMVVLSNPKVLLFFGAFIPQFVDPGSSPLPQVLLLGMVFMLIAAILDGCYALFAARAGMLLAVGHVRLLERLSGSLLIGGGLWMLSRRPA